MDVKDIREWFEAYAIDMGGTWSIGDKPLDEAAAEIAKLFDQQLQSEHEEIRIRTKREVELLAQLAEMRQVLELALRAFKLCDGLLCSDVEVACEQALSAAPEVLWAGEGTVKHKYALEDDPAVITAQLHFDPLPPGWLLNAKDGQQVKVIVVKEPGNDKKGA